MEILRKISSMISKSFKKLVNGMRRRESLTDAVIYCTVPQALEKHLLHKP
jgi:hypothetical protein